MGVYDRQIATAKRLIKAKGQSVTWRSLIDGAPSDPNEPWKPSAATPTDNAVEIAFFPYSILNKKTNAYKKNTEVVTGMTYGLMGQVDFEAHLKDVVIRDSKELVVETIDIIDPNGEKILYEIGFLG